jgi:hypothetical protein
MFGKLFRAGDWPARIVSTALVGVGLSVGGLAIAGPANAVTCYSASACEIGVIGRDARCAASPYAGCLYWYGNRSTSGAYWGLAGSIASGWAGVADLNTVRFLAGTGAGAGVRVRNNAAGIACEPVAYICVSYYSPNYTGNDDWLDGGQVDTLYLTWNNEASLEIDL